MSAITGPLSTPGAASPPAGALPAIDPAHEPAVIRNGNAAAKKAYDTGLAFEDMLVNQLAQEMTNTVPGLNGSGGTDGLGGSSTDGLGGTDPSAGAAGSGAAGGTSLGAYASMLPQALSSDIMSGGGTGLALQIARSLDPSIDAPARPGGAR